MRVIRPILLWNNYPQHRSFIVYNYVYIARLNTALFALSQSIIYDVHNTRSYFHHQYNIYNYLQKKKKRKLLHFVPSYILCFFFYRYNYYSLLQLRNFFVVTPIIIVQYKQQLIVVTKCVCYFIRIGAAFLLGILCGHGKVELQSSCL